MSGTFPFPPPSRCDLFARHGAVESVKVITDRETGRSRGFAFVEMGPEPAAGEGIRALDGTSAAARCASTRRRSAVPAAAAAAVAPRRSRRRRWRWRLPRRPRGVVVATAAVAAAATALAIATRPGRAGARASGRPPLVPALYGIPRMAMPQVCGAPPMLWESASAAFFTWRRAAGRVAAARSRRSCARRWRRSGARRS